MADDKKTNLPAVIENLPSTEVSRRDFLRGLTGTVVQGALPTGGLTDLIMGKGEIVKTVATPINQAIRKLLALGGAKAIIYKDFFSDSVSDDGIINEITDQPHPEYFEDIIVEDMGNYIDEINDSLIKVDEDIAEVVKDLEQELINKGYDNADIHFIIDELKRQTNSSRLIKWDAMFDDFYLNPKRLDVFEKVKELQREVDEAEEFGWYDPEGSGEGTIYDKLEILNQDQPPYTDDMPVVEQKKMRTDVLEKGIKEAIKKGQETAESYRDPELEKRLRKIQKDFKDKKRLSAPELDPDTIEGSLEEITKSDTFKTLRRALEKLTVPRQLKKAEAPKQIEAPKQGEGPSKSPVQMANIASALSRLKRATPLGAALYTMKPTELARDDDYGFEIPVDR